MITKEEFIRLIEEHKTQQDNLDKLEEAGLRIWDSNIIEYGSKLFDKVLGLCFNKDGLDWIYWWIYEKRGRAEMKAWDENKQEIPTETLDDLWELIKDYRKE